MPRDTAAEGVVPLVVDAVAEAVSLAAETHAAVGNASGLVREAVQPLGRAGWSHPQAAGGRRALDELLMAEQSAARLLEEVASVAHLLHAGESVTLRGTPAVPAWTAERIPELRGALAVTVRSAVLAELAWASVHRVIAQVSEAGHLLAAASLSRRMAMNTVLVSVRAAGRDADALTAGTSSAARTLASAVGSARELPRLLSEGRTALRTRPARPAVAPARPPVREGEAAATTRRRLQELSLI